MKKLLFNFSQILLYLFCIVFILFSIAFYSILADIIFQPKPLEMVDCPMDAKECSDGSYVGRIPPNCEFKSCPE